jgi:nucleoside-diphosphate-sugar epimerase
LAARFFYYDTTRARAELGFSARPLADTLADAFTFWSARAA